MLMRKICVIFPGIGYSIEKPLLYYSKKIANEHGYEVIVIEYSGIDRGCLKERETMLEAFNKAVVQAEEQLKGTDFASCEDVIFASKKRI